MGYVVVASFLANGRQDGKAAICVMTRIRSMRKTNKALHLSFDIALPTLPLWSANINCR